MKRRHSLNLLLMILKQHCVVVEFHNLHYCYSCGMYFTDGYKMSRGFLRSSTKQRFAALLVAYHLGKVLRYSPGNLRFFSVCGKKPYFVFSSFRVLLYLTETKIQWPEHCGLFCGRPQLRLGKYCYVNQAVVSDGMFSLRLANLATVKSVVV